MYTAHSSIKFYKLILEVIVCLLLHYVVAFSCCDISQEAWVKHPVVFNLLLFQICWVRCQWSVTCTPYWTTWSTKSSCSETIGSGAGFWQLYKECLSNDCAFRVRLCTVYRSGSFRRELRKAHRHFRREHNAWVESLLNKGLEML